MAEPITPTYSAFRGVRNTLSAERLGPNDLVAAVNVDLDDSGRASTRNGWAVKVAGAAHSIWADQMDLCLFVQSGALKRLMPDLATTVQLALGLTDDRMAYLKVNDRVYHTNGVVTGVLDGGRVRSWGMEIPPVPFAVPAYGHLTAGTYLYTMTRIRVDGQESGADLASRIDVSDDAGITFTWTPIADDIAIYITAPNGDAFYRAAVVDGRVGSYTWTGGLLATKLQTQFLDAPPAGQDLAFHNARIYVLKGSYLIPTSALGYEYCDMREAYAIDKSRLNFGIGVDGGLFVGTSEQVVFLAGGRLEEQAMRVVVGAYGVAGSALLADIVDVTGKGAAGQQVALFTTGFGVFMGLGDGSVVNLTKERYSFNPPAIAAAALRTEEKLTQYLVTG